MVIQKLIGGMNHGIFSSSYMAEAHYHGYVQATLTRLQNSPRSWWGSLRPRNQMLFFRDVLDKCEFMDLGFKGFPFTWSRHFRDGISI